MAENGRFMDGLWMVNGVPSKSDLLGYLVCKSDEKSVVGAVENAQSWTVSSDKSSQRNWWI